MRTKRRNRGLAMDESDSEEEDEEARALRRKSMNKKRRIEGDKLEDLGMSHLLERLRVFALHLHLLIYHGPSHSQKPGNQGILRCLS